MTSAKDLRSTLAVSHERLVALTSLMTSDQLTAPSYCDGWTIADTLSHLGSGAEIFSALYDAGLAGAAAPGQDVFQSVWDRWNAMSPEDKATNSAKANAEFIERLNADDEQLDAWKLDFFHSPGDATRLISMRLSEHVLHSWDIAVMSDPATVLAADAVPAILPMLQMVAARGGKPNAKVDAAVVTVDPGRTFHLRVDDKVVLEEAEGEATGDARVQLPAEALVRLVYGRLDPAHTPEAIEATGTSLDDLRAVFTGF